VDVWRAIAGSVAGSGLKTVRRHRALAAWAWKTPEVGGSTRNPARLIEKYAAAVVTRWVGDSGTVSDTSAGPGPDFEIAYVDGRRAIGEVGWHEDPEIQEMWAVIHQSERPQRIELADGRGRWIVGLVKGARVKALAARLPGLVDGLLGRGTTRLDLYGTWPLDALTEQARKLGIDYVSQVSPDDPSYAIYSVPGRGGIVPTDADLIADWLDGVLADPDYLDTTKKVLAVEAEERHVFVMAGSRTEFGVEELLRRVHATRLPTRDPVVPSGVTHIWVVSMSADARPVLWTLGTGWSVAEPPADDS
jgi:hypothetical protein